MPKIILVGVDGSESSRKAATVAAELAASTGATLHVLTAVDPRSHGAQAEPGRPSADLARDIPSVTPGEAAESIAADVAQSLHSVVPHIESSPIQGKPAQALVEEAKRLGADLIVVGNRRVQGIGRLLGSVATDVAQHAPCDVYIVKTV
jgi:nucleotide-binding universal stress UspA family protein